MTYNYILFFAFFLSLSSFSQKINLESCKQNDNIASRSRCLSNNVESLIINEMRRRSLPKDSISETSHLKLSVFVNTAGLFEVISLTGEPKMVEPMAMDVIRNMKPLELYTNKDGEALFDQFEVEIGLSKIIRQEIKESTTIQGKPADKVQDSTEVEDQPFTVIEQVPIYPGCYGSTNANLKKCMSDKISYHVLQNFNADLANNIDIEPGIVRIYVSFKITNKGYIENVKARAPHPVFEEEGIRVVESLPKMKPGKQKGKPVNVLYSLPIIFEVKGNSFEKEQKNTSGKSKND